MLRENSRFQAHPNAAFQEVDDEVFVVTNDNRLHNLRDPVAVTIWRHLEEAPIDSQTLTNKIVAEFDVEFSTAQADIDAFLKDALGKNLIEEIEEEASEST